METIYKTSHFIGTLMVVFALVSLLLAIVFGFLGIHAPYSVPALFLMLPLGITLMVTPNIHRKVFNK